MNARTIQTAVNAVYSAAILEAFEASNKPHTNIDLASAILGGSIPSEITGDSTEPFSFALLQLTMDRKVSFYRDDDENVLHDLWDRIPLEVAEASREECVAGYEEYFPEDGGTNNPANWRKPTEEVMMAMHDASRDRVADALSQVNDLLNPGSDTVH